MKHLFITQDYAPDLGGMARRHVELCRHFASGDTTIAVSTVAAEGAAEFDSRERYPIYRQSFPFSRAKVFTNQLRWGRWLGSASGRFDVFHCGNIRPVGYAILMARIKRRTPYVLYVNGGDLLRELAEDRSSVRRRFTGRRIFGAAAGIVATSSWVADLARQVMSQLRIDSPPPIGAFDLGTDPNVFSPTRNVGRLRAKWNVGTAPLVLTVARLVPHKGQDVVLQAVASLKDEFPALRYVIAGTGPDEARLRQLAERLTIADRAIFAGALSDDDVAEAYATATIYAGLSRVEEGIHAEGFGISFLEAAASGLPSIAGDSGGVRSAVRDGITGIVVPPTDVRAVAEALRWLLRDEQLRATMGGAGRSLVESYFNWERVARDTRDFTDDVVGAP